MLMGPATMAETTKEKADLGPFVAEFVMDSPPGSYEIQVNDPVQGQDHNGYWFRVISTASTSVIDIYIDDYGKKTVDVSSGKLMENLIDNYILDGFKTTWLPASIGGLPAVLAKSTDKNGKTFGYDAAYSPDGVGKQGSIIVYVCSTYPEDTTNGFLSKLKVNRA